MASFTRREKKISRVEYALTTPTNWAEIGKVLAALRSELPPELAQWDDTVTVNVGDDEIVFTYDTEVEIRRA